MMKKKYLCYMEDGYIFGVRCDNDGKMKVGGPIGAFDRVRTIVEDADCNVLARTMGLRKFYFSIVGDVEKVLCHPLVLEQREVRRFGRLMA